ncbi:MAG: hypothetical protein K6E58_00305 [Eubacterium sp.]|nr:hypothetical protein [Eubacterium sp.]
MKKLICLLLVAVMSIGLVACGGGLKIDDLVGQYDFIKLKQDGEVFQKKDIDKLNGLVEMGFEIKKDGKAYLTLGDDVSKGDVDVDKMVMKLNGENDKFTYDEDKGIIKLFDKKDYMILKKKKK